MAHTAGNWNLMTWPDGAFTIEGPGTELARPMLCQRNPWDHRAAESLANGRLMWASPKLLAAWVAFLASADAPPEQFDPAAQMAAIAAGRAAVAEAIGGPKP